MIKLNTLARNTSNKSKKHRTKKKTCGRGHKGQKSRSGHSVRRMFEGGQINTARRIPKSGFKPFEGTKHVSCALPLYKLNLLAKDLKEFDLDDLIKRKLIHKSCVKVKIFSKGELLQERKIADNRIVATKSLNSTLGV